MTSRKTIVLLLVMLLSCVAMSGAVRTLQEETVPSKDKEHKPELPPLPKVELPPIPEVHMPPKPEMPKVELPPFPEVHLPPKPELPKVELPPFPKVHPRIWLPVGKSGYRPVTGFPEHPRELH
jgi:hypothetical protein